MSYPDRPGSLCRLHATGRQRTEKMAATGIANPLSPRLAWRGLCLCLALAWAAQAAEPDQARRPETPKEPAATERVKKPSKNPSKLRRFVPTEKITADSAISFPVDI